jgi:hypothetical protein
MRRPGFGINPLPLPWNKKGISLFYATRIGRTMILSASLAVIITFQLIQVLSLHTGPSAPNLQGKQMGNMTRFSKTQSNHFKPPLP